MSSGFRTLIRRNYELYWRNQCLPPVYAGFDLLIYKLFLFTDMAGQMWSELPGFVFMKGFLTSFDLKNADFVTI